MILPNGTSESLYFYVLTTQYCPLCVIRYWALINGCTQNRRSSVGRRQLNKLPCGWSPLNLLTKQTYVTGYVPHSQRNIENEGDSLLPDIGLRSHSSRSNCMFSYQFFQLFTSFHGSILASERNDCQLKHHKGVTPFSQSTRNLTDTHSRLLAILEGLQSIATWQRQPLKKPSAKLLWKNATPLQVTLFNCLCLFCYCARRFDNSPDAWW